MNINFQLTAFSTLFFSSLLLTSFAQNEPTYPIVDTGQDACFNNNGAITCPVESVPFYGQDSQYQGNQPKYLDNGDGTITDLVTGLMWQKAFTKSLWSDAPAAAAAATTGGYTDWRVPTTKELYSLIDFRGNQGSGDPSSPTPPNDAVPFIDTNYFDFEYGVNARYIDAQYITSTAYIYYVMNGSEAFFGVNFADGRIKGYPQSGNVSHPEFCARYVRGNAQYGQNTFVDNNDGTITDQATGLMWTKIDSGAVQFANLVSIYTIGDGSLNWGEALNFSEKLSFAGHDDWRLPNAKELQSILDYSRAPDVTNSAAIDPAFICTPFINEKGVDDFPAYWSSTSFLPGSDAVVIFFGRALGYLNLGQGQQFYDVHGAGAQRTDPKIGEPSYGFGPQGDTRRIYNYVRPVRDADIQSSVNLWSLYNR